MKKWLRYGWITLATIAGILLLAAISIWVYLSTNAAGIKQQIIERIHSRTHGEVKIGSVSASFLNTFPFISLELANVLVRDSNYIYHKKDLLKADYIYLRVSPLSLMTKSRVGRIIARNGSINLIRDSTQYSNHYVLKSNDTVQEVNKSSSTYPDLELENFRVEFTSPGRFKLYRLQIDKLFVNTTENQKKVELAVDLNSRVDTLAFNLSKGSYLEGKSFKADIDLVYDKTKKQLSFPTTTLYLDNVPYDFSGFFSFNEDKNFRLSVANRRADFQHAVSLLPQRIRDKLSFFKLGKPVSFTANIAGRTIYRYQPKVEIALEVADNSLTTAFGTFEDCSFTGEFTNENDPALPHVDGNSRMRFKNISAVWEGIAFNSNQVVVTNLLRPFMECDITSEFPLTRLNALTESNTIRFTEGFSKVNMELKMPLGGNDSSASAANGNITLRNGGFEYIPRNIRFRQTNAVLEFKKTDLTVRKMDFVSGKSSISMSGHAENFLSVLNVSPEKLILDWNVYSPHLFLEDFKGFLSRNKSAANKSSNRAYFRKTARNVDKMFTDGDMTIRIKTPRTSYKKFEAENVRANVIMSIDEVGVKELFLEHAKGSMKVSGTMKETGAHNRIELNTEMNRLEIPALFTAFNNFGQDALTKDNLNGRISGSIHLTTGITSQAEMVKEETKGTIDFLLENGELHNFEPVQKISERVFKKQDFSNIRFADLKNRLDVRGTAFVVNRMEIRSTAITMFVEGIYDVKNGTDMSIQLPVRNLLKSNANTDLSDEAKARPGVSVRLRARTSEDGKLNITWDPFRRALKNKQDVEDGLQ